MAQAACRGLDPNLFYPTRGETYEPAREVCAGCSVADPCLDYAVERGEKIGFWGGRSELERRPLRRQRRAAARPDGEVA